MAANSDDLKEELVRLRDRMHKAETKLVAFDLLVSDMRSWRDRIDPVIEDLREADRIAEAVANKVNEQRNLSLTKVQKWAGVAGIVIAFLALILDVVFRLVHLVQIS